MNSFVTAVCHWHSTSVYSFLCEYRVLRWLGNESKSKREFFI